MVSLPLSEKDAPKNQPPNTWDRGYNGAHSLRNPLTAAGRQRQSEVNSKQDYEQTGMVEMTSVPQYFSVC